MRTRTRLAAALAGSSLLFSAAAPGIESASAATLPPLQPGTLSTLLGSTTQLTPTQISQLVNSLSLLQSSGASPSLLSNLKTTIQGISATSNNAGLFATLTGTLGGLITDITTLLNGGTPTPPQVQQIIDQLNGIAGSTGLPIGTGLDVSELASQLTTADLAGLLGQSGSPLSGAQITGVLGNLGAASSLPIGGSIPPGGLSAVASALQTVASQPGVPAPVASALLQAASVLGGAGAIDPTQLGGVLSTLEGALTPLYSAPVVGPTLGSVVQSLTTELATLPVAGSVVGGGSGAGGSGGGAGGGTSGGSGPGSTAGPATNPYSAYLQYLQTLSGGQPGALAAALHTGAKIRSLKASKGKVRVNLSCPTSAKFGCDTIVYLGAGSAHYSSKQINLNPGSNGSVTMRLTHKALSASKRGRKLTVTAATGTFTSKKTFTAR
jgi:hypothetical protein